MCGFVPCKCSKLKQNKTKIKKIINLLACRGVFTLPVKQCLLSYPGVTG